LAGGVVLRAASVLHAFRSASVSNDVQRQRAEVRMQRETMQFFNYKKRMVANGGLPPTSEDEWDAEEKFLFEEAHVTAGINFDKYDNIEVERIGGQGDEIPVDSFEEAGKKYGLPPELVDNLKRCGYDTPTPVQKHTMSAAFFGTDVMVSAETGSGKTAAFLVPIIAEAIKTGERPMDDKPASPVCVVLAPVRELCQQISLEARRLSFRSSCRCAALFGGAPAMDQLKQLAHSPEIVVATPGRLDDFCQRGVITMENVKHLVVDEADRMLDMGFEPQIRNIIETYGMPKPGLDEGCRQTCMYSATFPQEMQDMALDFLDPSHLWVGVGKVGSGAGSVDQRFVDISNFDEQGVNDLLVDTINGVGEDDSKTLVFANTKVAVSDLVYSLSETGMAVGAIHGGLAQLQRQRALAQLKQGRINVLVATEVAARGLDLPGLDHVINYELPNSADDYVHRIGRTGRIGNTGVATSFVRRFEPALRGIADRINESGQDVELPEWLEQRASRGGGARRFQRF